MEAAAGLAEAGEKLAGVLAPVRTDARDLAADATLLQQTGMTCAQTTTYMQQFLAAAGNKLPKPWILHASVPSFIQGKGGPGFKIKRVS